MRGPRLIAAVICTCACSLACHPSEPAADAPPKQAEPETPPTPEGEAPATTEQAEQTSAPPEAEAPPSTPPVDGFFMAEGAPQPRACAVASDCLGDTIPDLTQPCCQNPTSLEPYARAYRTWLAGWRSEHCEAVTCPPPPSPSRPPDCAFEVDCQAGTCVDSCS